MFFCKKQHNQNPLKPIFEEIWKEFCFLGGMALLPNVIQMLIQEYLNYKDWKDNEANWFLSQTSQCQVNEMRNGTQFSLHSFCLTYFVIYPGIENQQVLAIKQKSETSEKANCFLIKYNQSSFHLSEADAFDLCLNIFKRGLVQNFKFSLMFFQFLTTDFWEFVSESFVSNSVCERDFLDCLGETHFVGTLRLALKEFSLWNVSKIETLILQTSNLGNLKKLKILLRYHEKHYPSRTFSRGFCATAFVLACSAGNVSIIDFMISKWSISVHDFNTSCNNLLYQSMSNIHVLQKILTYFQFTTANKHLIHLDSEWALKCCRQAYKSYDSETFFVLTSHFPEIIKFLVDEHEETLKCILQNSILNHKTNTNCSNIVLLSKIWTMKRELILETTTLIIKFQSFLTLKFWIKNFKITYEEISASEEGNILSIHKWNQKITLYLYRTFYRPKWKSFKKLNLIQRATCFQLLHGYACPEILKWLKKEDWMWLKENIQSLPELPLYCYAFSTAKIDKHFNITG
jgi:hypothetical protein